MYVCLCVRVYACFYLWCMGESFARGSSMILRPVYIGMTLECVYYVM